MQTSETIHPDKNPKKIKQSVQTTGDFVSGKIDSNVYIAAGQHALLALHWITSSIVRVKLSFRTVIDWNTTIAVQKQGNYQGELHVTESSDRVVIASGSITAIIYKSPMTVEFYRADGSLVWGTDEWSWDSKGTLTCSGPLTGQTQIYGMGETTGFLNKRGERYTMWNSDVYSPHVAQMESLYLSVPFMIMFENGNASGVYLDNPGKVSFDFRARTDGFIVQAPTGDFDFYIMAGQGLPEVLNDYTLLTGRMAMPPKWSIGYHQSRYSYMNQEEVINIAKQFRERNIPCDVIYLDIHYMDEYRVFTFDKFRFPAPDQLVNTLKEMGIRVIPIVDPGVKKDPKYTVYQQGIKKDYFCRKIEGEIFYGSVWPGECAFPDFSNPQVATWWANMHQFYLDLGMEGIWNDMNEPAVFNESKTMDLDVLHDNEGTPRTHEEIHNMFGLYMTRATYDGLKRLLNGKRPFLLTRAGYSGIQRYGSVWTGDNRSFWEHLALASPMLLNMGLSGVAFSGTDIGGFAHHATGELLARWTQIGALSPFCRNHSAIDTVNQEPWAFGDEIERICKKYIELRYQWMPMIYTLFEESARTGAPILRPLVWEFPHDTKTYQISDQWLLGSSIMVAPIDRPNTEHRIVYLPEGTWYDYWTGEAIQGGKYIMVHAPLDTLPIMIRAGSMLVEDAVKLHIDATVTEPLKINIYVDPATGKAEGTLYEDDGSTFSFEEGQFNRIHFTYEEMDGNATFIYTYEQRGYHFDALPWVIQYKGTNILEITPDQNTGIFTLKAQS